MDPSIPRNRSPFLATRFLPLASVRRQQGDRFEVAETGRCQTPETFIVAPGFSQRICNVTVRAAFSSNTKDKHLLGSCECRVFQEKKSTQHIRDDLLGVGFAFARGGHGSDRLQCSFMQCCIDC